MVCARKYIKDLVQHEVDVITDHLPDPMDDDEAEYWEMKAEIHYEV